MDRSFPALFCLLLLLSNCSPDKPGIPPEAPRIDYVFLDLDKGDSPFSDLWDLITDSTDVYMAVSEWSSPTLNQKMVSAFDRVSSAQLNILTDPNSWDKDTGDSISQVRHLLRDRSWMKGQIVLVNDRNPRAGRLGELIHDPSVKMRENFILFSSLKRPEYGDAQQGVLFLSAGVSQFGFPSHSFGLLIRGDVGLGTSYYDYWTQLRDSRIDFDHRKVRTYSDQHDHRAWFYPDRFGKDSSTALISSLMEVVSQTGKPAKVRIYMPEWDESHLELAQVLKELAIEYEADVRILAQHPPFTADVIRERLEAFPEGMVRWVSESTHIPFIILDGPLSITEEASPERKQVVWVGSHVWNEQALIQDSNSALAIISKSLADDLEEVWWTIWKDHPPSPLIDSLSSPD